ncbi:Transglutaminase-like superfamily protein [Thalassoglobus neptunius]|uniref:Transglutaminase-like superfamily protein n=1 Tax=Thalassoglobus neptunius TaxID=1938619 RepID=A0A5C5X3S8_9PLAN|nr:transglutaminase-like domain-containing protein [Thalassoglobus neptunius]TWT57458.1 Transglutaminase-like superfamily protein [Thalassoglobus neptunius]
MRTKSTWTESLFIRTIVLLGMFWGSSSHSLHAQVESPAEVIDESWQTVSSHGERIGYAHSLTTRGEKDGEPVIVSDLLTVMTFMRFGQQLSIQQSTHVVETIEGDLISFASTLKNPPNSESVATGEMQAGTLTVTSRVAGETTTKSYPEFNGIKSSVWPERFVREGRMTPGEVHRFQVFEPALGQAVTMTAELVSSTAASRVDARNSLAESEHQIRFQTFIDESPAVETIVTCDAEWSFLKSETPILGIVMSKSDEHEALAPVGKVTFDFAKDSMIPVTIEESLHSAKSVTYRIEVAGANAGDLFSKQHSQLNTSDDAEVIELSTTGQALSSDSPGREFSVASPVVESDHELIQKLAAQAAGDADDPLVVARHLTIFVDDYVTEKNFATSLGSALETAQSRAGDCTEHSVLLAALLRARGIPSRVVVGFVYSNQLEAFVGHLWTEAWVDGKWMGLDALDANHVAGPGHLAMKTASLSGQGTSAAGEFFMIIHLLGRTKIDVLEVVR